MNNLALFDFDGTITRKDTFKAFILYCVGPVRYLVGLLILSPALILYKVGVIPNWRAKEIVFSYFFKGISIEVLSGKGKAFAENEIPRLIRPSALQAIQNHRLAGDRVVIVTASSALWISGWSDPLGLEILATEWAQHNGRFTGKLQGENCYGKEKRRRVLEQIDIKPYPEISVYGDTSGDRELLTLATKRHYRFFQD